MWRGGRGEGVRDRGSPGEPDKQLIGRGRRSNPHRRHREHTEYSIKVASNRARLRRPSPPHIRRLAVDRRAMSGMEEGEVGRVSQGNHVVVDDVYCGVRLAHAVVVVVLSLLCAQSLKQQIDIQFIIFHPRRWCCCRCIIRKRRLAAAVFSRLPLPLYLGPRIWISVYICIVRMRNEFF